MKCEALYRRLKEGPLILDGATGSNLQKAGMPAGVCPEQWILEHPEALIRLQRDYVEAGAGIVYAPTFSANRIKLAEYGLADQVGKMNRELAALSRKAVEGRALVAGDLTMTGAALAPVGTMELEELIDIYKEQAGSLLEGGVDLFVVETMMSLAETRAAVLAIKEICDLPVIASLTFQEDGRTLYGTDPVTAVVVLQSIGTDVIGVNCSTGPEEMLTVVRQMKEYADVPILAKPNAGLPVLIDGETIYPMQPEEFASYGPALVEAGAAFLGGCCGTTPDHIRLLSEAVSNMTVKEPKNLHPMMLASERKSQEILLDGPFLIIGERINPTGKKKLQKELREGRFHIVEEMAEEQEEMGAHILDINMGTNGIDEKEAMLKAIDRVTMVSSLPLCIDTSYVEVMEAALLHYPGRALINSISMEQYKIEKLLPLVKKYGAMFILLPLSDQGLPADGQEKKEIIEAVLARAETLGIHRDQIIVDGLVTTAGANPSAALDTLETIRYCREELGLCTTVGLSNISFGLPERAFVNGAFASMAIARGLTMAIANPSNLMLMGISSAADLLRNTDGADVRYIHQIQRMAPKLDHQREKASDSRSAGDIKNISKVRADIFEGHRSRETSGDTKSSRKTDPVYEAVLKGNKEGILDLVRTALDQGHKAEEILEKMLIPAINKVGALFERQIYFLPQLISSAGTMEKAVRYLEPMMMKGDGSREMPTIVIATVEGDIHDIGKNLVALMLRNYGYRVIDLGKDVPASRIIEAAREEHAQIIALSALMTTTMMRMEDTVKLRDQEQLPAKVIIGGAVTNQNFSEEIGADGYSSDAADAVKLVKKLLS